MTKLPPALQGRSDREAIWEDVAPYRGMTVGERSAAVSELCRWARDTIDASRSPEEAWRWQDKRSPESLAVWQGLLEKARRA